MLFFFHGLDPAFDVFDFFQSPADNLAHRVGVAERLVHDLLGRALRNMLAVLN